MKWISVKDKNPEIYDKSLTSSSQSKDVLVIDSSGTQYVGYLYFYPKTGYRKKEEYYWSERSTGCGCCSENLDVTHWMELPDQPKEDVSDLVMQDHEQKLKEREKNVAEKTENR